MGRTTQNKAVGKKFPKPKRAKTSTKASGNYSKSGLPTAKQAPFGGRR